MASLLPAKTRISCLSFTHENCTLRELLEWSHRQIAITRVYDPALWRLGLAAEVMNNVAFWGGIAVLATAVATVGERRPLSPLERSWGRSTSCGAAVRQVALAGARGDRSLPRAPRAPRATLVGLHIPGPAHLARDPAGVRPHVAQHRHRMARNEVPHAVAVNNRNIVE